MIHERLRPLVTLMQTEHGANAPLHRILADELGCARPFVSVCFKRGWFPPARAGQIAERYDVPSLDLINPVIRNNIQANA